MTSIRTATKPNNIGVGRVDFVAFEYDNLIFEKGYPVIVYEAVRCPCNDNKEGGLSGCQNCLGLGWTFINPIKTKAIITSINKDTKYKYWSAELMGTVALTVRDSDRLSAMDKVVLKDRTSIYSELRDLRTAVDSQKFIFTTYPVNEVVSIFLFEDIDEPLIKLDVDEYLVSTTNTYVVKLNTTKYPTGYNGTVSIKYKHNIQYNVTDLPHDVRFSTTINKNGKEIELPLPVQAIAVKSEFLTGDSPKYDGSGVLDNSYL